MQGELEGKRSEMDTLETLLQRRERESQEGATLLTMLRDDFNTATQQRSGLSSQPFAHVVNYIKKKPFSFLNAYCDASITHTNELLLWK